MDLGNVGLCLNLLPQQVDASNHEELVGSNLLNRCNRTSMSLHMPFVKTVGPAAAASAPEEEAPVAKDTGQVDDIGTLNDFDASTA